MNVFSVATNLVSNLNPFKYYYYETSKISKFIITQEELENAIKNLKKVNLKLDHSEIIEKDIDENINEDTSFKEKKDFFEKVSSDELVETFNYIE